jgi:DNA-binding transcriptional LysR family regulator
VLRASLPVDFATIFLAPLIAEFARRYPGIGFDFDLPQRRVDLVAEPFDVAIRMGDQPDSNLIARLLARLPRRLYASPRYLEHAGDPSQPADLASPACLLARTQASPWTLHDRAEAVEVPVIGRFRLNSVGMMQRLDALNMVIAMLAEVVVADDLAAGRLRRALLPEWQGSPIPVDAITQTRLLPAKTQRFIAFLRERLTTKDPAV